MASTALASLRRRLETLQKTLGSQEAVLVSKPTDIFYFTHFPQLAPQEREAFLLVTHTHAILFHHSFSPMAVRASWLTSVPKTALSEVAAALVRQGIQKVWLDETTLSVAELHQLQAKWTGQYAPMQSNRIWQQRTVKDREEITRLQRAGAITARTFRRLRTTLKAGITEQEAANRIVTLMLEEGAQETAFPVIVAFGPHGALPHHQPTNQKLTAETPVLVDFGARVDGYCADLTRSFWFGKKPSASFRKAEALVQTAYERVLAVLVSSPRPTAQQLDAAAREWITQQGFGTEFIHTTGHGVGIEIHEPPSLSWNNADPLLPGTVVTVEPGVYLPDQFGYRHENTVLFTAKKPVILTHL